jgi:hypothetical protein
MATTEAFSIVLAAVTFEAVFTATIIAIVVGITKKK